MQIMCEGLSFARWYRVGACFEEEGIILPANWPKQWLFWSDTTTNHKNKQYE
jgi:hypothetical protein